MSNMRDFTRSIDEAFETDLHFLYHCDTRFVRVVKSKLSLSVLLYQYGRLFGIQGPVNWPEEVSWRDIVHVVLREILNH